MTKTTNGRSETRIRIAIQKSGRLNEKSMALLEQCGLEFEWAKDRLFCRCENFPIDLMLVRDDDIPEYVADGVCDLGVVGINVLEEKMLSRKSPNDITVLKQLGFGHCRLSLAMQNDQVYNGPQSLQGLRIATTYPATLQRFLNENKVDAKVVEISGSVEVAPALQIADAVCDLVSTGSTLRSNGLKEVAPILESQSVLIRTAKTLNPEREKDITRLLTRLEGSQRAAQTKYIMMNAPLSALPAIKKLIPGMEEPSVMPLNGSKDRIAIHAVASENIFWETMEELKEAGASSILVLPIEKIIS